MSNLSGAWVTVLFTNKYRTSVSLLPSLFSFIGKHQWLAMFISWSNIYMELILPWAIVIWMENGLMRTLFHVSGVGFHISIFALMGPNFLHVCVLHLLASDPLGWPVSARYIKLFQPRQQGLEETASTPAPTMRMITWRDWMQVLVALCCLVGWFRVNFLCDIDRLMGKVVPRIEETRKQCVLDIHNHTAHHDGYHYDPYLPFSTLPMFTWNNNKSNFTLSLSLLVLSVCIYLYAMCYKRSPSPTTNKWSE
jgi:hypothetical protein